jgi:GxxExxY protein
MKYEDLTRTVIGCAMEVHRTLGNGYLEAIYQKALTIELKLHHVSFVQEYEMPIYYKQELLGSRRADFFIESVLPVEIKAVIKLDDSHLNQALNYLEVSNTEIGLLFNFGSPSLDFKRLYNKKYKPDRN